MSGHQGKLGPTDLIIDYRLRREWVATSGVGGVSRGWGVGVKG